MKNKEARKLISKYLHGSATEDEIAALSEWAKKNNNGYYFKEVFKLEFQINSATKDFDHKKALQEFLDKNRRDSRRFGHIKKWGKYAAIFIGLIGFTAYLLLQRQTKGPVAVSYDDLITLEIVNGESEYIVINGQNNVVTETGESIGTIKNGVFVYAPFSPKTITAEHIFSVPYGKRFTVQLPDSTIVYLNSGTRISYAANFIGKTDRIVQMEGEAYFDVAKDSLHPFYVYTDRMATRVYGTSFNISSYKNDESTDLVLVEGSVALRANSPQDSFTESKNILLSPNERAYLANCSSEIIKQSVDVNKYISWKEGILMFENEPMAKIIKKLERHFNIEIENNNQELSEKNFTGRFDVEDINEILETIRSHTHFNYERTGNRILIR